MGPIELLFIAGVVFALFVLPLGGLIAVLLIIRTGKRSQPLADRDPIQRQPDDS